MGGSATGSEPLLQRLLSLETGRSFFAQYIAVFCAAILGGPFEPNAVFFSGNIAFTPDSVSY